MCVWIVCAHVRVVLSPPSFTRCRSVRHGACMHACAWCTRSLALRAKAWKSRQRPVICCSDRLRSRINTGIIFYRSKIFSYRKKSRRNHVERNLFVFSERDYEYNYAWLSDGLDRNNFIFADLSKKFKDCFSILQSFLSLFYIGLYISSLFLFPLSPSYMTLPIKTAFKIISVQGMKRISIKKELKSHRNYDRNHVRNREARLFLFIHHTSDWKFYKPMYILYHMYSWNTLYYTLKIACND